MLDRQALWLYIIFLCASVQGNSVVYNPCMSQIKLSEAEAFTALESWPHEHDESRVDHSFKCTLTCLLMDVGLVNKNGQVQMDKYVNSGVLDKTWVISNLASCRAKYLDEQGLCEYVFGIFNCFREMKLAAEKKV